MYDYTDLYDPDDYDGHDTGDDCNRLLGRHTEAECRYFRDELARREAIYTALGCGREYHRLMAAERRHALPRAEERRALPVRKRLPAPDEGASDSHSNQEDA